MLRRTSHAVLGLMVVLGLQDAPAFAQSTARGYDIQFCNAIYTGAGRQATAANCYSNVACTSACCPEQSCGGCDCLCDCCEPPWSIWIWGAPTYVNGAAQGFGFSEGVTAGYRLNDALGLYGAIGFNHTDVNTQFLGTVGLQRFGNPDGETFGERTSVWVLWDQYAESDTNTYFHQFRFNLGYVRSERTEIGMTFSVSTSGDDDVAALVPMGGSTMLSLSGGYVGPYVTTEFGGVQWTATAGYADGTNRAAFGLGAAVPVSDNTNIFMDAKHGGDDIWALSVGLEVGLGRADTRRY